MKIAVGIIWFVVLIAISIVLVVAKNPSHQLESTEIQRLGELIARYETLKNIPTAKKVDQMVPQFVTETDKRLIKEKPSHEIFVDDENAKDKDYELSFDDSDDVFPISNEGYLLEPDEVKQMNDFELTTTRIMLHRYHEPLARKPWGPIKFDLRFGAFITHYLWRYVGGITEVHEPMTPITYNFLDYKQFLSAAIEQYANDFGINYSQRETTYVLSKNIKQLVDKYALELKLPALKMLLTETSFIQSDLAKAFSGILARSVIQTPVTNSRTFGEMGAHYLATNKQNETIVYILNNDHTLNQKLPTLNKMNVTNMTQFFKRLVRKFCQVLSPVTDQAKEFAYIGAYFAICYYINLINIGNAPDLLATAMRQWIGDLIQSQQMQFGLEAPSFILQNADEVVNKVTKKIVLIWYGNIQYDNDQLFLHIVLTSVRQAQLVIFDNKGGVIYETSLVFNREGRRGNRYQYSQKLEIDQDKLQKIVDRMVSFVVIFE